MTAYANYGRFVQDLRKWNAATQQLVNPVVVYVYQVGTTTAAQLWSSRIRSTATSVPNNPVATGVPTNSAGIDATGNLVFFAEAGDYDVVADGNRITVACLPLDADVQAQIGTGGNSFANF